MVRCCFNVVLAVSLLLIQSAAVLGRAHAESHQKGHDPRPHIHTGIIEHDDQEPTPHDDDAVYVSHLDAMAVVRGIVSIQFNDFPVWITDSNQTHSTIALKVITPPRPTVHPPDDPVPLYLRQLTILI